MNKHLVVITVLVMFSISAYAEESTLTFVVVPINHAYTNKHAVTPYRIKDEMIVTVEDPIACGQKAGNPTFSINNNKLSLKYDLTPAALEAKGCMLVSEFRVSNLPHKDIEVDFAGGKEPYVVAKLKKCPYYEPKSADIYECLSPSSK